jgi:hypothetical protein
MPGELNKYKAEYKNKQHEQAMKAPVEKRLDDELREKGLI